MHQRCVVGINSIAELYVIVVKSIVVGGLSLALPPPPPSLSTPVTYETLPSNIMLLILHTWNDRMIMCVM